jgi:hypothetical protein
MTTRRRRTQSRPRLPAEPITPVVPTMPALLYTRKQASAMLNVSTSFLLRMEAAGTLKGIKLTNKPTAMTFYAASDLITLASGR